MDFPNDRSLEDLEEALVKGDVILFIGAGLSIGAGLPSWSELIRPLANSINYPLPKNNSDITSKHLLLAAQYYEDQRGRNSLIKHLNHMLDTTLTQLTIVHQLLASLPVQIIFTSNYDNLIERVFHENGRRKHTIVNEQELSFWSEDSVQIVKLCGTLEQPDSIIVTQQDFSTYFDTRPRLAERLRSTLEIKTPLFLGYGLQDPFFDQIWDRIGLRFGLLQREGFAVMFNAERLIIDNLRKRHIRVINLKPNAREHSKILADWLNSLLVEISNGSRTRMKIVERPKDPFESLVESKLDALLYGQSDLKQGLKVIYQRVSEVDRETLDRIFAALEEGRIEHANILQTVESIRKWAKFVQKTELSIDPNLSRALGRLSETVEDNGGLYQYLEISLPLIPGVLTYKTELGSEHRIALRALWEEIKCLITP